MKRAVFIVLLLSALTAKSQTENYDSLFRSSDTSTAAKLLQIGVHMELTTMFIGVVGLAIKSNPVIAVVIIATGMVVNIVCTSIAWRHIRKGAKLE